MEHITNYINMTHQEQTFRLREKLPSLEEYWSYRLGSSAVNVTLSVHEFVLEATPLMRS